MNKADKRQILVQMERHVDKAETELTYKTPFELLVAVVLSAQATDRMVNVVTPILFERFPTVQSLAEASLPEIEVCIQKINLYHSKAKYLKGLSQKIHESYNDEIPQTFDELVALPGVGRKTANVVLSIVFGEARIAVDTHVERVSKRVGFTTYKASVRKVEEDLYTFIPKEDCAKAHHVLILFGRYICTAKKPKCDQCHVRSYCRTYAKEERKREQKKK